MSARHRSTRGGAPWIAKLSPHRRSAVNAVGLGVWGTGVLWLVFHYFLTAKGELGPEPNPLEPWWLKLHAVFAFGTIWTLGLLWGVHIVAGWGQGRRRWSGSLLLTVMGSLVVTGYLLYYAGSDAVRAVVSIVHWAVGLAAPALYLAHRLAATRRRATVDRPAHPAADPSARAHDDERSGRVPGHRHLGAGIDPTGFGQQITEAAK